MDDWVLCRVSHKGQRSLQLGFNEVAAASENNFLADPNFVFVHNNNNGILNGHEHQSHDGSSSSQYLVPDETQERSSSQDLIINEDSQYSQANSSCYSMTEALDKIKRVLSLGSLHEQEQFLHSVT